MRYQRPKISQLLAMMGLLASVSFIVAVVAS
jgi:hypothetical protein